MNGVSVASLTTATTGSGTTIAIPSNMDNCQIEVLGAGTVSGGTLLLEENANDPAYTGTWSTLATITASTLTGGASQVFHILGTMRFFRGRVSASITGGGTVSVNVIASK